MDLNEYIGLAIRTESSIEMVKVNTRLNHGVVGIVTEAGELIEAMQNDDMVNVKEETGDILWYLAILMDELSLNFDDLSALSTKSDDVASVNETVLRIAVEASKLLDDLKKQIYYNDDLDLTSFEKKVANIFDLTKF